MLDSWSTSSKIALGASLLIGSLYLVGVAVGLSSSSLPSSDDTEKGRESASASQVASKAQTASSREDNSPKVTTSSKHPAAAAAAPAASSKPQLSSQPEPAAPKNTKKDIKSPIVDGPVALSPEEEEARFEAHVKRAWDHWNALGAPRFHVAPMVDQSELPFRQLCRKYGAQAAYSPMMNSRIFAMSKAYRDDVFSTCPEDRPLFVQFCGNDPATLLRAARLVEDACDYIDLNTGCPQRIAKKGHYGAFLMDEWDLLERIIRTLSTGLKTPVSVKIRIFPEIEKTVAYARMFERAGASVVAVHGRTRDQKSPSASRASWDHIKAVKEALRVPVIANGNVRTVRDAEACLAYTGCDAIMSAESLLTDPALFDHRKLDPDFHPDPMEPVRLAKEYLEMVTKHPTAFRMVRGHLWSILGDWLHEFPEIQRALNDTAGKNDRLGHMLRHVAVLEAEVERIIREEGRTTPKPKISRAERERLALLEAKERAIEEQDREESALNNLSSSNEEDGCGKAEAEADFEIDFDSLGSM